MQNITLESSLAPHIDSSDGQLQHYSLFYHYMAADLTHITEQNCKQSCTSMSFYRLWGGEAAKQKTETWSTELESKDLQVWNNHPVMFSVFIIAVWSGESRKELLFELICQNIDLNLTWGPISVQITSCRFQLKLLKVSERPNASRKGSV